MRAHWQVGKHEGVRGLYAGLAANLLRAAPNVAIQFAAYGMLKDALNVGGD